MIFICDFYKIISALFLAFSFQAYHLIVAVVMGDNRFFKLSLSLVVLSIINICLVNYAC